MENFNEEWREVRGYEGLYEVSNMGNVRSLDRIVTQKTRGGWIKNFNYSGRILKPDITISISGNPYYRVTLSKDNKTKRFMVHRLVAENFLPNNENKDVVDHIDGCSTNNNVNNLRWVTTQENNKNPIHIERLKISSKGRKVSKETSLKISNSNKRRTQNPIKGVVKLSMDGEVIEIYKNINEAATKNNCHRDTIGKCCRGIRKQGLNYQWRYL